MKSYLAPMSIAYLLFDGITLLDFIGVYDPVCRLKSRSHLPDLTWDLCALTPRIRDSFGLEMAVDKVRPDLAGYDMIIVPGGFGTRALQHDPAFTDWLRTAAPVSRKVSVCTGSLLLGAAGFLAGRRATTHFGEYDALAGYCGTVVRERIVTDGPVTTAGAVASSLDLGLNLCAELAGEAAAEDIRRSMNYRP